VAIPGDIALAFVSEKPRSLLTRLPGVFRHASTFRPGFVGAWTYWLLFGAAVLLAPVALGLALLRTLPGRGREPETTEDATLPDPPAEPRPGATLSNR
jgi:hypothetical protein